MPPTQAQSNKTKSTQSNNTTAALDWKRPQRAPLKSGMLQNRKLDMPKQKRAANSGRR
jgi:hypothetical protein